MSAHRGAQHIASCDTVMIVISSAITVFGGAMDVLVRSMDTDTWRRLKAQAALQGKTIGALLTEIITEWLARQQG